MRLLIAATAALSVLGGSAALAQPYGYQQGYYDQRQAYRDQSYGRGSYAPPVQYGYAQPYGGNAYNGGPAYYGARTYSYNNADRHMRREPRRDRERHYVAPRGGYDRHR
jgi:hypothetical protein